MTTKVFGIGLPKTGTSSLNVALELLGLHSIHYPADPQTRDLIIECILGGCDRLQLPVLEWCDALTDAPVCAVYQALDAAYPGSKFILSSRDKEDWLGSCSRFYDRAGITAWMRENPADPWRRYLALIHEKLFGVETFEREAFAAGHDRYHAGVAAHFADRPDHLLTIDVCGGAGWDELCAFLDREPPGVPWPVENRTDSLPATG